LKDQSIKVISPGRVNLLGEHVDYNGGLVLPAAIDRSVTLISQPRTDNIISLFARDFGQRVQFNPSSVVQKQDIQGNPLPTWALYPAGVLWSLSQRGAATPGIDCNFSSNIPIGAGLSSSAAVEVGFAVLWQTLGGWEMNRLTLAQVCQHAEREYVGVNCGLMDQFACANGVEGHAVLLDTRSLQFKPVPLPANTAIVIADSSIRRSLIGSAYNNRRLDCETAVKVLQQVFPSIVSLRYVSIGQFLSVRERLSEGEYKHARHVVEEIERVNQAMTYLENGEANKFGKLMFETHASLRDYFEVSCPELDTLVEIAAGIKGCIGARLTGAGFGGCTVNLVEQSSTEEFVTKLIEQYHNNTSLTASVFVTHASQGAHVE
jgi:galactokinase